MPEKEQQIRNLSERVVKEAVGVGLETPMREPILEAIEESGETSPAAKRQLPMAGALLGLGAAAGYLIGRSEHEALEGDGDVEGPAIIENILGESTDDDATDDSEQESEDVGTELEADADEADESDEDESGRSVLPRLLLAAGILGAIALVRRRLKSEEAEEWEPIEEFEPAVEFGDESEDEAESESDDDDDDESEDEAQSAEATDDETEE